MNISGYPIEIRAFAADEGSGFLAIFPDLPGCVADGDPIPEPDTGGISGKFVPMWQEPAHPLGATLTRQEGAA